MQLTHRAVLEKLRFKKKKSYKNFNLKNTEIYGPIILPKEVDQEPFKIYLHKEF